MGRTRADPTVRPALPLQAEIRAIRSLQCPRPSAAHLEHRVNPQGATIIGVLIAGGDREHAEATHFGDRMSNILGGAGVVKVSGEPLGNAELALDLA